MEFTQKDFIPVLFGNDINVYSVARAFYEEYKVKSRVFGKALISYFLSKSVHGDDHFDPVSFQRLPKRSVLDGMRGDNGVDFRKSGEQNHAGSIEFTAVNHQHTLFCAADHLFLDAGLEGGDGGHTVAAPNACGAKKENGC